MWGVYINGDQIFDRTKMVMRILLLVVFTISVKVAVVGGAGDGNNQYRRRNTKRRQGTCDRDQIGTTSRGQKSRSSTIDDIILRAVEDKECL